ncbi:ANTAR domain-containing protein [Cellulomonas sp. NPDC058312]|uniref:ANTAR domain-containing protein n=1 Tax=Cellulomonas sp. NPDC058312 TaxID=3346441 RepID=UPI0036E475ED
MTDRLLLLEELARAVATPSGAPAAERACGRAVDLLGARGGVLTAAPCDVGGTPACATDPVAARLGELEQMLGDGPGARAYREGRSVEVPLGPGSPEDGPRDARPADALPLYRVLAAEIVVETAPGAGPVAVRSWPVRSGTGTLGALTVHGLPSSRGGEVVHDGQVLADALAPALHAGATDALRDGGHDAGHVRRAVGMVVAQTHLPPADAAELLRARAWALGLRVVDLATAVLARSVDLVDEEPDGTAPPSR